MNYEFLTMALPAGRMMEESLEFLKFLGYSFSNLPLTRELSFFDDSKRLKFYLVRNQDVPLVVLHGGTYIGICGKDILLEKNYDLSTPFSLPFGYCRLSLAIPQDIDSSSFFSKIHIRVVTKYPNLTREYFSRKGINAEIIKLHGSIELGPILGISDCIVDIVSTGRTLKENGLKEIDKIIDSNAVLIVNPSSFYTQNKLLLEFLNKLRKNVIIKN